MQTNPPPYHAVFREDRATTKGRVVLSSSATIADGVSPGVPVLFKFVSIERAKLQPDLGRVLMRFPGVIRSVLRRLSRECFCLWNTQDVLMFTNGLCIVIEEDPRTKRSLTSGLQSVDKGGLLGFRDASQRVYGSAAFLCDEHEDGSIVINLVYEWHREGHLIKARVCRGLLN